jgi:threonine dehydratase
MNSEPSDNSHLPSYDNVLSASKAIEGVAHRTPIWTCQTLNEQTGLELFFKCENFQKAGAFKFRGAVNAIRNLSPSDSKRGVVTHSSGNHAGALSLAAKMFGVKAHIVMPENSSAIKIAAVKEYGGLVTLCAPTLEDRLNVANAVEKETGATMVPPFDHPDVIAGQGTCAKELIEDVKNLDAIVAPIGGGGLMAGTCISTKELSPNTLIIGAEPEMADDAFRSKQAGEFIPQLNPRTIADGLRTSLGELTWPFIRNDVDQIVTISEQEILETMKSFFERSKLLIETSCNVAVAAAMSGRIDNLPVGARVGVIITGGNVDLTALPF